jgi:hypothetical protein
VAVPYALDAPPPLRPLVVTNIYNENPQKRKFCRICLILACVKRLTKMTTQQNNVKIIPIFPLFSKFSRTTGQFIERELNI